MAQIFFKNRQDVGKQLAKLLLKYKKSDAVIYALPRGGVVLGFEIAKKLNIPLDIVIARKISHPFNPEFAVCAITEEGDLFCNETERSLLDPNWLEKEVKKEQNEATRRRNVYLGKRPHISTMGKIAIIVDDGIATGLTVKAAIKHLKKEKPKKIVVAVPVGSHDIIEELEKEGAEIIALKNEQNFFGSVGAYYNDFSQVTDEEVVKLLKL